MCPPISKELADSYCDERAFVWIKVQCYECQKDEPWFFGDSWLRWKRRGKAKWVWLDNYKNPFHKGFNGTLRGVDAENVPDALESAVEKAGGDKVIEACK